MEIDGFNITIPYKQEIMKYVDQLDESAEKIGAVNTVVYKNGKWIGYNTDGIGYVQSLNYQYPYFFQNKSTKKILILGAGGAARGIYYALNDAGFLHIDIANRTVSKALDIRKIKKDNVTTNCITLNDGEQLADQYDLIIQTTNVGMAPNEHNTPIELKKLKEKAIVSDIVYTPFHTLFLKQGMKLGANIHNGHSMLIFQGVEAFRLWTGIKIDPSLLLTELEDRLKNKKGDG